MAKFNIQPARKTPEIPIVLPTDAIKPRTDKARKDEIKTMQRLTGSLLYLSLNTRGDIAKATHYCTENSLNPAKGHIEAATQIIQYAYETRTYSLLFDGSTTPLLSAATDAAFADDQPTKRSSHGYVIFLCGAPVFWASKKQSTVATSTTEAELTALSYGTRELIALTRLLRQMNFEIPDTIDLLCDNEQTVNIVNGRTKALNTRLRHINIQQHWLREVMTASTPSPLLSGITLKVKWVPTDQMPADGLTKLLDVQKHKKFLSQWGYTRQIDLVSLPQEP
jgi:hypothetical protein